MRAEETIEPGNDDKTAPSPAEPKDKAANEERRWKTMEICVELGVPYHRLAQLARRLRKRREVKPEKRRGQLFWSDANVELLRRRLCEWNEQEARVSGLQGSTTAAVAAGVGLKRHKVLALMHEHGIEVARRGGALIWEETAVARLRAILDQKGRAYLTGDEVAKRLKISYPTLYHLVRTNNVPLRREGNRILWDEAAVSVVSELARQLKTKRASENRMIETQTELKELGTPAVCRRLGVDYTTLIMMIRPFRAELKLSRRGRLLIWTPEAVARVAGRGATVRS